MMESRKKHIQYKITTGVEVGTEPFPLPVMLTVDLVVILRLRVGAPRDSFRNLEIAPAEKNAHLSMY